MERVHGDCAFPSTASEPGMSLRDYFAGEALQMIMAWSHNKFPTPSTQQVAGAAYEIADAMLAERAK